MLARMLGLMAGAGIHKVSVVGDAERYGRFGAACVEDVWPGEGPLGGIVTALRDAKGNNQQLDSRLEWNLMVSCDMPFLTRKWLAFLVERALASEAQVVLARSAHGLEPLCACWRRDALETLQVAFERGVRRGTEGISLLRAEVLDERDWKRFDSAGRLFWNMNTKADYEEARHILEAEQK